MRLVASFEHGIVEAVQSGNADRQTAGRRIRVGEFVEKRESFILDLARPFLR